MQNKVVCMHRDSLEYQNSVSHFVSSYLRTSYLHLNVMRASWIRRAANVFGARCECDFGARSECFFGGASWILFWERCQCIQCALWMWFRSASRMFWACLFNSIRSAFPMYSERVVNTHRTFGARGESFETVGTAYEVIFPVTITWSFYDYHLYDRHNNE